MERVWHLKEREASGQHDALPACGQASRAMGRRRDATAPATQSMGKQHGRRGKVEADMRTQARGRGENKLKNQGF